MVRAYRRWIAAHRAASVATSITTDPRAIAGVAIAERVPWLLFILPGGAWADRLDRRVLRMRLDAARALVMAGLVFAIAFDRVTIVAICAVAALLASAEAVVRLGHHGGDVGLGEPEDIGHGLRRAEGEVGI